MILPPYLSTEAKSFITSLLQKNPNERLGSGGFGEICAHPFFEGIDWERVQRQDTPLPHANTVHTQRTPTSRNYFDRFAYFVDGTCRSTQKRLVKRLLIAWMRSNISDSIFEMISPSCYGSVPCRGVWNHDVNGYFQFMNKDELVQHLHNEIAASPAVITIFKGMVVRVDESSVLFEGDRCICQWRAWG